MIPEICKWHRGSETVETTEFSTIPTYVLDIIGRENKSRLFNPANTHICIIDLLNFEFGTAQCNFQG